MASMNTFDSTKVPLQELLLAIRSGRTQLPDFQRGWVWDDERVRNLLASVSRSFPIGAVMMLEAGSAGVRFKPRLVEGLSLNPTPAPDTLILDGQQRLTSLFQALMLGAPVETMDAKDKKIWRWYYIDIAKALDPYGDRAEAVFGVPPDRVIRGYRGQSSIDLSTPAKEQTLGAFPVSLIFDVAELTRWSMGYLQLGGPAGDERMSTWNRVLNEIIYPFQQYLVPLITLRKDTPKDAVCQVFENVNTGGEPLTVFELLTATFAADDFGLREDWDQRKLRFSKWDLLADLDSDSFLQCVTLLSAADRRRTMPSAPIACKRRDILDLSVSDYLAHADRASEGFERAAHFLYGEKIFTPRELPYGTQLVPLAAILAELGPQANHAGVLDQLRQWYWCGVLGELYGSTVETRFARDLPEVIEWAKGGPQPSTVVEASFFPARLRTLRSRNSAAYKGVNVLLMREGAQDLKSGRAIDVAIYADGAIDIHHIFPQAWCENQGVSPGLFNSIINKTPLSAETNRSIGGAAPSAYVATLEKRANVSAEQMDAMLRTHLIEPDAFRIDDFSAFFDRRERALLGKIEGAMGKQVVFDSSEPSPKIDLSPTTEDQGGTHIRQDILGVVLVEGDTDEEYLRLAADIAGRPELLEGLQIVSCQGVNGVVQQALFVRKEGRPLVAVFDRDELGRKGRERLCKDFGFQGKHAIYCAAALGVNQDEVEAEDLFPPHLMQLFVDEYGEDNVLSEKRMLKELGRWHFGFNAQGKDLIAAFIRERASAEDVVAVIRLIEIIRESLGLEIPPPRAVGEDTASRVLPTASSGSSDLRSIAERLREAALSLSQDVSEKRNERYVAYRTANLDNFMAVKVTQGYVLINLALGDVDDDPDPAGLVQRYPDRDKNSVWAARIEATPETPFELLEPLVRHAFEFKSGLVGDAPKPWLTDGRKWHLETRCGPAARMLVERLVDVVSQADPHLAGPKWNAKNYISWTRNGTTSIWLWTRQTQAELFVREPAMPADQVAQGLNYALFSTDSELAEKLGLGPSVIYNEKTQTMRIRIKSPSDLDPAREALIASIIRGDGVTETTGAATEEPATATGALREDPADPKTLEAEFHRAMVAGCDRLQRETGYNPTRFRLMIAEHGGVGAAKRVVSITGVSEGFNKLWEAKRLEMSAEFYMLLPRFADLFTEQERDTARRWLEMYEFDVDAALARVGDGLP